MSRATAPWTASDIPDLHGRRAVVTGASAGLGLETARRLAEHGAEVILACRDAERAEAAAREIRRTVPAADLAISSVDFTSQQSVRTAADELGARYGHLDLLVNNAGIMTRRRSMTADGFETVIATNHLGPFAFTGRLLGLLAAAPRARVVTVSSGTAGYQRTELEIDDLHYERRRYEPLRAYGQSKLANLLFAFEFQRRLSQHGSSVSAMAVYPGVVQTDFTRNVNPVLRALSTPPMDRLWRPIVQSVEMGALPTLRAATDPSVCGGQYLGPAHRVKGYPVPAEPGPKANDRSLAAALWARSEQLTGVAFDFG